MELARLSNTVLPFLWALVPLTVEDSSVPTAPELGGMNFPWASHGLCNLIFFTPHSLCGGGAAGRGGFLLFTFLLELDSYFLRTD